MHFFKNPYLLLFILLLTSCRAEQDGGDANAVQPVSSAADWQSLQDADDVLFSIEGLAGPEAVRYDPGQDVYFVSNFNGDNSGDANGFISRVNADGAIEALEYMVGTAEHPMHGPRGMYIVGNTLWAADAEGIHGFDRTTGAHTNFVDFTSYDLGFLNDIVQGPDGALYVTETSDASRVFRVMDGSISVAMQDTAIGMPNGIAWNASQARFVVVPWTGTNDLQSWSPGSEATEIFATSEGGNFDGIEMVGARALVASQMDSTLRKVQDGVSTPYIHLPGKPADIGIDTRRMRVAVPYIGLNRVDVWALPQE